MIVDASAGMRANLQLGISSMHAAHPATQQRKVRMHLVVQDIARHRSHDAHVRA